MEKKDSFKLLDHTADILFQCDAASLEGVFVQAGLALAEITTELSSLGVGVQKEITGKNKNLEYLFFDFLDDLLFYKDSELLVFKEFAIKITLDETTKEYALHCVARGEALEEGKHERKLDIKAITMHMFEIGQDVESGRWHAQVLVDI